MLNNHQFMMLIIININFTKYIKLKNDKISYQPPTHIHYLYKIHTKFYNLLYSNKKMLRYFNKILIIMFIYIYITQTIFRYFIYYYIKIHAIKVSNVVVEKFIIITQKNC